MPVHEFRLGQPALETGNARAFTPIIDSPESSKFSEPLGSNATSTGDIDVDQAHGEEMMENPQPAPQTKRPVHNLIRLKKLSSKFIDWTIDNASKVISTMFVYDIKEMMEVSDEESWAITTTRPRAETRMARRELEKKEQEFNDFALKRKPVSRTLEEQA